MAMGLLLLAMLPCTGNQKKTIQDQNKMTDIKFNPLPVSKLCIPIYNILDEATDNKKQNNTNNLKNMVIS
jgi:hypothetical protein